MPNTERLNATLEHIREDPDTWDQTVFRNGDHGCFAFHAALLAGAEIENPDIYLCVRLRFNEAALALGFNENDTITIEEFAQRALELDRIYPLFLPDLTLADLERLVAKLSDQETVDQTT